jgi:uncharacterized protein YggU (UPF0235/DUF167 family)
VILELHVQPGAAPPVEGKANAALVEFLEGYFNVPKRVVIEGAQWKTKSAA